MNFLKVVLATAVVFGISKGMADETKWQKNHPRINKANERRDHQENQVKQGVQDGQLSKQQGKQIMREEHTTQREEARDIRRNEADGKGDHLTAAQSNKIERQDNHIEKQIKTDEAGNTAPPPAPGN